MAKVSVIVPIYGVEKYLKQAIDSILNQSLYDLEIILINDGSKDGCPQIVNDYAKIDNRILAIHKENGGYGSAMNVGLNRATGDYIAILEPDDFVDSKMYEDLYKIAVKYNSDIVKSAYWEYYDNNSANPITKYSYWANEIDIGALPFTLKDCPVFLYHHPSVWSAIYKRKFLEENNIKFVEAKGGGWVDNPFQVETFSLAKVINWTPNAYYYYRPNSIGNSSDLKDYKIPLDRFNEIHDFYDSHQEIYNGMLLEYVSKKEIAYLYNAFKIAFRNAKNFNDIFLIEKDFKYILKRIPHLKKSNIIDKKTLAYLNKMKTTNYLYRYLRKKAGF